MHSLGAAAVYDQIRTHANRNAIFLRLILDFLCIYELVYFEKYSRHSAILRCNIPGITCAIRIRILCILSVHNYYFMFIFLKKTLIYDTT